MKLLTIVTLAASLAACTQTRPEVRSYGNDALPSAEVTAFQATHARLNLRDARIEHDAQGCAVYQGRAADGQVRTEPLRGADGQLICQRR